MDWEWDDDGVPVLTGYEDHPPATKEESADLVIVHADNVLSHRFPDSNGSPTRAAEEREAFLAEADPATYRVSTLSTTGRQFDQSWTTLLATPNNDGIQVTDIEADLTGLAMDGPSLFLGRRGSSWWIGAQGSELVVLDRHPHPETTSVSVFLHEILDELLSIDGLPSRTLTLFGDQISLDILKDLTSFFRGRIDGVERFNPFRHMRAELEPDVGNLILKRAHLLGCFVGAISLHAKAIGDAPAV